MKRKANLLENDPKRAKIDDPASLLGCYQKICEIFKTKFKPEEMREAVDQYEEKFQIKKTHSPHEDSLS